MKAVNGVLTNKLSFLIQLVPVRITPADLVCIWRYERTAERSVDQNESLVSKESGVSFEHLFIAS